MPKVINAVTEISFDVRIRNAFASFQIDPTKVQIVPVLAGTGDGAETGTVAAILPNDTHIGAVCIGLLRSLGLKTWTDPNAEGAQVLTFQLVKKTRGPRRSKTADAAPASPAAPKAAPAKK